MRCRRIHQSLAMVLLTGVLAACGSGHGNNNRGASGGSFTPAPVAAPIAMAPPSPADPTRRVAECMNRAAFAFGAVETAIYTDTAGFSTSTVSTRQTISGPVTLNTLQLIRADLRTITTTSTSSTTQDDFQLYGLMGDDALSYQITYLYGATTNSPAGSVTVTFDTPLQAIPGSLTLGASRTLTSGAGYFDSRNNSSTRLNYLQTFTFDALETVAVPAGTFPGACRVLTRTEVSGDFGREVSSSTNWYAARSGVLLRSIGNNGVTSVLQSATFNGAPVVP